MPVFTANVPGILKVGDKIEIGGKIKEKARKMSVNLCAQEGEEPRDVVLHFDVRFHRDNIISLSRKNGIWIGSGNYDTNYNMFVPGTIFRIIFEIKDTDVITIYCQGKFHSNFLPKIPLTMARYIVAWADIERISHCYFHLAGKHAGDENTGPLPPYRPPSPRQMAPSLAGDNKRGPRMVRKISPGSPPVAHSSNESSDEDTVKNRMKVGRANRFFYETLMCPQTEHTFPNGRRPDIPRTRAEYNRKYDRDESDTEKNDSECYSEDISKNETSILESDDIVPELKRNRRGKFSPFANVVNFIGKNGKRN
ncbi:galactoside-binding lectin domain-containing protein [Phthorimaea operculella]|nr:galactoside-binding lectin domain-containing protein [Phthorimaea operculella]